MINVSQSSVFPNSQQLLLLQALCASDKKFPFLWKQWKKHAGSYALLDHSSLQLFPLVYKRLSRLLPNDSWVHVAKNSYHFHWMRNQLLFQEVTSFIKLLVKKKTKFLILKGAAFVSLYYANDIGSRHIDDIDVFVSIRDFSSTVRLLQTEGWVIEEFSDISVFDPDFFHSLTFKKNNHRVDLHCHVFSDFLSGDDGNIFFPHIQTIPFVGQKVKTLGNSDQLIHVLVHGLQRHEQTQLRWIIDAYRIIKTGKIDWQRVVELARVTQSSPPVIIGLEYVQKYFSVTVPSQTLAELRAIETPLARRRLFLLTSDNIQIKPFATVERYWWIYWNSVEQNSSWSYRWRKFIRFLKFLCQTPHLHTVPWILTKQVLQLLLRSFKHQFVREKFQ